MTNERCTIPSKIFNQNDIIKSPNTPSFVYCKYHLSIIQNNKYLYIHIHTGRKLNFR